MAAAEVEVMVLGADRDGGLANMTPVEAAAIVNVGVGGQRGGNGKTKRNWKTGRQERCDRFPSTAGVAIEFIQTEVADTGWGESEASWLRNEMGSVERTS